MPETTTDVVKGDERIINTTTTDDKGKKKKRVQEILDEKDPDPKAQPPLIRKIEEEFDDDGDQIKEETTTSYKDGLNKTPNEKIVKTFYTDPSAIEREIRSRWVGGGWKKESDYSYDRKGTATKN